MSIELNRTEYPEPRSDQAPIVDDGYLYEPRAFWEVVRIDTSVDVDPLNPFRSARTIRLNPENWYNGSKHTIVFTKLLLSPINYTLQQFVGAVPPAVASDFNNCGSAVNRMEVVVNAPRRQRMASRPLAKASYVPQPACTPSMEFTNTPYASSLLGLSKWTFDKAMKLPNTGSMQLDISSRPARMVGGPDDIFLSTSVEEAYQAGGWGMRHARTLQRAILPLSQNNVPFPAGSQSFGDDAFGHPQVGAVGNNLWIAAGQLTANEFRQQNANRGAKNSWVQGFSVMVDQINYDEDQQASPVANVPGSPITPYSQRLACRARTTNGGTNQWWWRPGAPVALVCPTITPASVMELQQPIKLGPGDSLELEVTAPNPVVLAPQIDPTFQFGVSLTGYAIIEG